MQTLGNGPKGGRQGRIQKTAQKDWGLFLLVVTVKRQGEAKGGS